MPRALAGAALVALALQGCAVRPSAIGSTFVPPQKYAHLDCAGLQAQRAATLAALQDASHRQSRRANADMVVVTTVGIPVAGLGDHAAQVAQLKGELAAVESAHVLARCPIR